MKCKKGEVITAVTRYLKTHSKISDQWFDVYQVRAHTGMNIDSIRSALIRMVEVNDYIRCKTGKNNRYLYRYDKPVTTIKSDDPFKMFCFNNQINSTR